MPENVRLIVWDLDETFWKGTVTEGGHRYDHAAHDAVIELARRGIMSSICSKNDLATVKTILESEGIWDYFIFPSINWEPKGARIRALIEDVQLRPETVLFIDDNHLNLQEACYYVPGLQVASEAIVPTLLSNPLLKGKDDGELSRLKQYKLMETRKADQAAFTASDKGDNVEFLRGSDIRIRIEHDVEKHIDRVIELINRTNQLNFTKRRLPEEAEAARVELKKIHSQFNSQSGLVEVSDRYGNYGFCGYFEVLTKRDVFRLEQFCFSCRILNMGVEAWVYQWLGRPELEVEGEVLSDPVSAAPVDWIRLVTSEQEDGDAKTEYLLGSVMCRGGCALWPLAHYFRMMSPSVTGEYNSVRGGNLIRLDHSLCLRHAIEGVSAEQLSAVAPLGYIKEDFETQMFEYSGDRPVWIFSNWTDINVTVFKHKETGMTIPFRARQAKLGKRGGRAEKHIEAEFEQVPYGEDEIRHTMDLVCSKLPANGLMFILLPAVRADEEQFGRRLQRRNILVRCVEYVAARYPNVRVMKLGDFIANASEVHSDNYNHFDRKVYFRLFERISEVALQDGDELQAMVGRG